MLGMDYTSAKWHNVLGMVSILIGYAQGGISCGRISCGGAV